VAGTGTSAVVLVREEGFVPPTDLCVPAPATYPVIEPVTATEAAMTAPVTRRTRRRTISRELAVWAGSCMPPGNRTSMRA
jgi:hypothetical protein